MLKRQLLNAVLTLSLSTGLAAPVAAAADPSPLSLKQAMQLAIGTTGGEVIKTETAEFKGRAVYKIRLVNEGRVKEIMIDSQNGKVITPDTER